VRARLAGGMGSLADTLALLAGENLAVATATAGRGRADSGQRFGRASAMPTKFAITRPALSVASEARASAVRVESNSK
jgi:hypothetical protein